MVSAQLFIDAAADAKVTFAEFFVSRDFAELGGIDPKTNVRQVNATESLESFKYDFDVQEVDGHLIKAEDFKLLIVAADVTEMDFRAKNIEVTLEDSSVARIINATIDPANAIWILHARKK